MCECTLVYIPGELPCTEQRHIGSIHPQTPHKSLVIPVHASSDPIRAQIRKMVSISGATRFLFAFWSISSLASAQICGTLGYHNATNLSYYMGNFFYNGLSTFTLCAAYCQQDTQCEAFRYSYWSDANAQYCEFFNTRM